MSTKPFELYTQLMHLISINDAFYFKDFSANDPEKMYRIFNYRLASYSDFCMPAALEARGIMFLVGRDGSFVDLVCRPPRKFFNLGENPFTLDLDISDLASCMVKEDGSLMSTYLHTDGTLKLKSKGSTGSDQCIDAMKWLNTQPALMADLKFLVGRDFTVNLEWVAPFNRIVVGYQKPNLVGLSIIDNDSGAVYGEDLIEELGLAGLGDCWVDQFEYEGSLNDAIENLVHAEGVVGLTSGGTYFKMKCPWYLALHRNKDNVSNTKALVELVLMEQTDDLKILFAGDTAVIDKITAYEIHIGSVYNQTCAVVESFHKANEHLERKDYAIAAKDFYHDWKFGVQMSLYTGKPWESQIKEQIHKNYSDYVLKSFEGKGID